MPPRHREEAEFGKAKKGVLRCTACGAFYYRKSWHHDVMVNAAGQRRPMPEFPPTICPACRMIRGRQYEGKLFIEHIPRQQSADLFNLVNAYCGRAYALDPQDRLISLRRANASAELRFSDNQLAMRLAKKIRDAFNTVDIVPRYAKHSRDASIFYLRFR